MAIHINELPDFGPDRDVRVALEMGPADLVKSESDGWVDLIAGYEVMSVRTSTHDGLPATLITLSDSLGEREVGIIRIRQDAERDAQLEVTRIFESPTERDKFVRELAERPGTDEIKTIELDTAHDTEELIDALQTVTRGTTISYRVVNPNGPGGGWPVIAYTGMDRELRFMLKRNWSMDAEEIDETLS